MGKMSFCAQKFALFNLTALIALALVKIPGVRTESETGLPCPCDGPPCVPLTQCRRLLADSADGDVRYAACPAGGKECCCPSSITLIKPTKTETEFLNNPSEKSSGNYEVTTEPSTTDNLLKNDISYSNANASYIKETSERPEIIEPVGEIFFTENGGASREYSSTGSIFASEDLETTTPLPTLDPSPEPEATESHWSEPFSWATGDLRIVGGSYDPLRNDNWTVHITTYDYAEKGPYQCTGSLISSRHVLTAAHCMYDRLGNRRRILRLSFGLQDKNRNRPRFVLEDNLTFIQHPNFGVFQSVLLNDIALIRTGRPVPTNGVIKAIRLVPGVYTTANLANIWVRVTGWGGTYPRSASDLLLQTDMQIRDITCTQNPAIVDPRSHLCLVGVNKSDICDGDSGAPLTVYLQGNVYLVGVISSGSVDCSGNRPAVAVFVGYHRAWIEGTITEVEPGYLSYVQFA